MNGSISKIFSNQDQRLGYRAEAIGEGTLLVLEDLPGWGPGADPLAAATYVVR
jgi:hypothetical protein